LIENLGKPIDLEFTDAIGGRFVSIKQLKGKVVVLDFWATWCGPCVAEMPRMKKLYAEFKGRGVEFIGVSLDAPKEEGGLDKLKSFVAKNEITWPQYYQGDGFDGEFTTRMGVNMVPQLFLIDTNGNLASIDAQDKLDLLIPELLEKAKAGPKAR
jgi:thiol-disulfide isomerase/thioredoxin